MPRTPMIDPTEQKKQKKNLSHTTSSCVLCGCTACHFLIVLWLIVKIAVLLREREDMTSLPTLPPEGIFFLRLLNEHPTRSGTTRRVNNNLKTTLALTLSPPSSYLKDSEYYSILLYQLTSQNCALGSEYNDHLRAQYLIHNALALGTKTLRKLQGAVLKLEDIAQSNWKK
jgi:hypothetical protein